MALLDICEYRKLTYGESPAAEEPNLAFQQLAVGAGSVASAAFGSNTRIISLHSDVNCRFIVGTNPNAADETSRRLSAGVTEYFSVSPGYKVAVVTSAS